MASLNDDLMDPTTLDAILHYSTTKLAPIRTERPVIEEHTAQLSLV